jgi:hypothetical protein
MRKKVHLEDQGVDGRLILKIILKKLRWGRGMDLSSSGNGDLTGSCECGNEPSGSIKCGGFLG